MDEIRKKNAKELRKKWNKFLKEQNKKNAERTKQGTVQKGS